MGIPVPVVSMVWFVVLFNLLELFSLSDKREGPGGDQDCAA